MKIAIEWISGCSCDIIVVFSKALGNKWEPRGCGTYMCSAVPSVSGACEKPASLTTMCAGIFENSRVTVIRYEVCVPVGSLTFWLCCKVRVWIWWKVEVCILLEGKNCRVRVFPTINHFKDKKSILKVSIECFTYSIRSNWVIFFLSCRIALRSKKRSIFNRIVKVQFF